jgi:hypothetical protein
MIAMVSIDPMRATVRAVGYLASSLLVGAAGFAWMLVAAIGVGLVSITHLVLQ